MAVNAETIINNTSISAPMAEIISDNITNAKDVAPAPVPAPVIEQPAIPVVEEKVSVGTNIMVKVSRYDPALGGVNCFSFVNGECISHMSSGLHWQEYMDVAIACPAELPFWTKIYIRNDAGKIREWICLDRGGAILYQDGVYWIDQLTRNPEYAFGTVMPAVMVLPD